MKVDIATVFTLATVASGAAIEKRQARFDVTKGSCKDVVFIFARGTTEAANIGAIVGRPLLQQLEKGIGKDKLAVEGVTYAAGVMTNIISPGGADPEGVKDAKRLFNVVSTKCPSSTIIAGGYSQGAAIMHKAAEGLPANIVSHIAGIALFGDTQNKQSGGHIKGFPTEKSKVFCESNDGVCGGLLNVNAGHLAYLGGGGKLKEGADWLIAQVKAFKPAVPAAPAEPAAPAAPATPATPAAPAATATPAATAAPAAGDMAGMAGMEGMDM